MLINLLQCMGDIRGAGALSSQTTTCGQKNQLLKDVLTFNLICFLLRNGSRLGPCKV